MESSFPGASVSGVKSRTKTALWIDGMFALGLGSAATFLLLTFMAGASPAVAQSTPQATLLDRSLPSYTPTPIPSPTGRHYLMSDGSVRIVGFDDMASMVATWDAEFTRTHPGIRFTPILKGNGTAIAAITYDMAAFAPEGGGATLLELLPYEKIYGSKKDPVAALIIRVGHGSLNPAAKMSPLGIIVNKSNPLPSLTVEQVASIFSTGSGTGDTTNWTQLGMTGALADKPIHPAGLYWDAYQRPEDPYMGEYMMYRKMGAFPGYVFSPSGAAIPTAASISSGRYPLARPVYIYLNRRPSGPIAPEVAAFVAYILSEEGQATAARTGGYLPLPPQLLAKAREALQ
jgi:phosphate transport system substrate-binding protein